MIPSEFFKEFSISREIEGDGHEYIYVESRDHLVSDRFALGKDSGRDWMRTIIRKEATRLHREWWFLKHGGPG